MAKIYPDTNRFIDFYQAAADKIDVFDQLSSYKHSLILTEQTIVEVRRNRVSTLNRLAAQFKKSIDVAPPYTTSLVRALPGHDALTKILADYKKAGGELLRSLEHLIEEESADPVAQKFLSLVRDPAVLTIPLTDDAISLARRRKILGNPPTSPDKHTIGDEVIWELLLANLREDLVIVTRDQTFHDNLSLLREEYKQKTSANLLLVTEKFSEALSLIGQAPSPELLEVEDHEAARQHEIDITPQKMWNMTEKEICPSCGKKGQMDGYEGSDGDSACWFQCSHCGFFLGDL